jgi:hypothetical protein
MAAEASERRSPFLTPRTNLVFECSVEMRHNGGAKFPPKARLGEGALELGKSAERPF